MRIALPAGLVAWSVAGGALLIASLLLIAKFPGDPADAFTLVLAAFAVWAAAGVEGLFGVEELWRPPFDRISALAAATLPLLLILAAFSQCLTLSSRDPRPAAPPQHANGVVVHDLAHTASVRR